MLSFDVLNRTQPIHRHTILEASAGTGKTFAIENITVRLLIESDGESPPLTIDKILIVTFTRAATRDLKERIHKTINQALHYCGAALNGENLSGCPDYLLRHMELGFDAIKTVKRYLEQALFNFDQAQIFTIHGFCGRMLSLHAMECGLSYKASIEEDAALVLTKLRQAVHNFLHTEITTELFSPEQLNVLLKSTARQTDKLEEELLKIVQTGSDIVDSESLGQQLRAFQTAMSDMKQNEQLHPDKILADFFTHVPSYKGLCDKSSNIFPAILAAVEKFAALFKQESWELSDFDMCLQEGICFLELFDNSNLKSKKTPPAPTSLNYPCFMDNLRLYLQPIVDRARHAPTIWAKLARACQQFIQRYQAEEELLGPSDLLHFMCQATQYPEFIKKVRQSYTAAIVDEFQDTDPIQWEIFAKIFASGAAHWPGYLYLVGDPKQSIYAFRQADIYTYLAAVDLLGRQSLASLDKNFRSHPNLIAALNTVFSAAHCLFALPKIGSSLAYKPVMAGKAALDFFPQIQAGLEFWELTSAEKWKACEDRIVYPAIAAELMRLKQQSFSFGQCAILVANRFQAESLGAYLLKCNIPIRRQKASDLAQSIAFPVLRELLWGILYFRQRGSLLKALAGKAIGMDQHILSELHANEALWQHILQQCDFLRNLWLEKGFGIFFSHLMNSIWTPQGTSLLNHLIQQKDSGLFVREWQDIADVLILEEGQKKLSPEALIEFLDHLTHFSALDDARAKGYVDLNEDGVFILTTHISKGLEFDFVFTPGLCYRTKIDHNRLLPISIGPKQVLRPIASTNDPAFIKYCEEIDAEKMRQLYVALTRARLKVYIPVYFSQAPSTISLGEASPMDLLMAKLAGPHEHYLALYARLRDSSAGVLSQFTGAAHISMRKLTETTAPTWQSETPAFILDAPHRLSLPVTAKWIQSFTSLTQGTYHAEASLLSVPHDFAHKEKSVHTLPAGAATGIVLHQLFESLSFDMLKSCKSAQELLPCIRPLIRDACFLEWEEVLADIVFNALTLPLQSHDGQFCLADIHPARMYKEMEFMYACSPELNLTPALSPGYLKGVIDLIFAFEGKYYLLDWKSNWLGPSQEYYQQPALHRAMRDHGYELQIDLYIRALSKYLKTFDQRPFAEVFGGVYYLFLRGLSANTGVWSNIQTSN